MPADLRHPRRVRSAQGAARVAAGARAGRRPARRRARGARARTADSDRDARSAGAREADARRRASGRGGRAAAAAGLHRRRAGRGTAGGRPLLVVLDGIEDPQNVGAILRSADAAGAHGVIRQARHAAPLDGATAKASAGAVNHVRIATVVNISRALEELKELNVWTVGFDGERRRRATTTVDYTLPTALVFGAEGTDCGGWSGRRATGWCRSRWPGRCRA